MSAPYDPVRVRRGDPLGFRQTADWYADLLAPGLSNRTIDARWVTLLVWVLHEAHGAWERFHDGAALDSAAAVRAYYEWVKPLELLWVARAATLCDGNGQGRQLPGIRGVSRWLETEAELPHFGLSTDQYRRYRQTGIYGAYRVLLRHATGLTLNGDGFRPTRECGELIDLVRRDVPRVARSSGRRKGGRHPELYWQEAWAGWSQSRRGGLFPTLLHQAHKLPDKAERLFLKRVLFGSADADGGEAQRRSEVASLLAMSRAKDHWGLCEELAGRLRFKVGREQLAILPHFAGLADAGVDAMDCIWRQLTEAPRLSLKKVAARAEAELARLQARSEKWRRLKQPSLRGGPTVDKLADAITRASSDAARAEALVSHHQLLGGGLRWVRIEPNGTHVVRVAPERLTETSRYRFRLYALGRLGRQCGLIDRVAPALAYSPGEED